MKRIELRSYAKINPALDVIGKRDDGYHDLRVIMQSVDLADDISVSWEEKASGGVTVSIDPGRDDLPADNTNDASRAALRMASLYGKDKNGNIDIKIVKRVPAGAGLAGGSGNGAALLHAVNILWELGLTLRELTDIAAGLGADIPFQAAAIAAADPRVGMSGDPIASTCALCEGIGEILTPLRPLDAYIVISKPAISVSTREVYEGIDDIEITGRPDTEKMIKALAAGDSKGVAGCLCNVLEMYTLKEYNQAMYTKCKMRESVYTDAALMSGSGPAVFALVPDMGAARDLYDDMKKINDETFIVRTI